MVIPRAITSFDFQNDGNPMGRRSLNRQTGGALSLNRDRGQLQKVKCIASKSEIKRPKNPLKINVISHFEVVGAFLGVHSFHILKSILDLATPYAHEEDPRKETGK